MQFVCDLESKQGPKSLIWQKSSQIIPMWKWKKILIDSQQVSMEVAKIQNFVMLTMESHPEF